MGQPVIQLQKVTGGPMFLDFYCFPGESIKLDFDVKYFDFSKLT